MFWIECETKVRYFEGWYERGWGLSNKKTKNINVLFWIECETMVRYFEGWYERGWGLSNKNLEFKSIHFSSCKYGEIYANTCKLIRPQNLNSKYVIIQVARFARIRRNLIEYRLIKINTNDLPNNRLLFITVRLYSITILPICANYCNTLPFLILYSLSSIVSAFKISSFRFTFNPKQKHLFF